MQKLVQYLVNNPDVLVKVEEGNASLIGVDSGDVNAILEAFTAEKLIPKAYYWK